MEKRTQDYTKEILEVIRSNISPAVLSKRLQDFHENDIADVLPELSSAERNKLYRIFDLDTLSDILEYTDEEMAVTYLEEMSLKKAAAILSRTETNILAEILQHFDKEKRRLLIELLDDEARHDIEMINSFDEEEIGSRMTTNYIVIQDHLSVKEAMSALVSQAAQNDNISTIFVVNSNQEFYGAIDLKDLIIARQDHPLSELIVTSYPYVYGTALIDDCMEDLKDYSEDSIPVLDNDNRLIGVITSANIVDLVDDEMGEDYAKLAGLTAEEDLKEPLKESMKKRMPWLIILLGLGMVVSSVVGIFEKVVTNLPIIMCFQSLILDMAGNVGTQSLAVTIRVLMDENLKAKQKLGLILKEARIGLANGLVLGVMTLAVLGIYIHFFKGYDWGHAFLIAACVGGALITAMVISSIVGTVIPMFFHKIHVDPAVASGPLITTVNDLVAVITYYGLSLIILIDMFHIAG